MAQKVVGPKGSPAYHPQSPLPQALYGHTIVHREYIDIVISKYYSMNTITYILDYSLLYIIENRKVDNYEDRNNYRITFWTCFMH